MSMRYTELARVYSNAVTAWHFEALPVTTIKQSMSDYTMLPHVCELPINYP